jgi:hypothetical protein
MAPKPQYVRKPIGSRESGVLKATSSGPGDASSTTVNIAYLRIKQISYRQYMGWREQTDHGCNSEWRRVYCTSASHVNNLMKNWRQGAPRWHKKRQNYGCPSRRDAKTSRGIQPSKICIVIMGKNMRP